MTSLPSFAVFGSGRPARHGPQRQRLRRAAAAAACTGALLCAAASCRAAPLDDMRRLVDAGQYQEALAVAQANPQLIGDVHFDFLYGMAAINAGRVAEGLLALERHLAAVPANDAARLELARGYFLLGDYARARTEFEFVLRYNQPAGVRARINEYLQAMQVRAGGGRQAAARLYAEAGLGHDSNVNGGTYQDQLQLVFGAIDLNGSPSRQVSDDFAQVTLGGQKLVQVSNRVAVFAGADLDQRENFREKAYNLTSAGVNAGFTQLAGNALWRLTLAASTLQVGSHRYRDTLQLQGEGNFTLDASTTLQAQATFAEQHFAGDDAVRDARAAGVAGTLTHNFDGVRGAPSAGVRVGWTQEMNTKLRSDLSRDTALIRVFGALSPLDRLRLGLSLTLFTQHYGNIDFGGFGTVRKDTWMLVDGSASYAIDANWSLRAEASWIRSRSNQDLYDSNRKTVALKARYQY